MRSKRFAAAMGAAVTIIAAAGRVDAQVELAFGPFVGFTGTNGGKPTSTGLQTSVISGPIGVRLSGFGAIDQNASASSTTGAPRYGGDADVMLLLNLASRRSNSVGVAPYVFAGAGLTVRDEATDDGGFTYDNSRFVNGWSYGGGILIPFGAAAQLTGEIRARPNDGFTGAASVGGSTRTEYRVGLSLRLDNLFGGRRRSAPNDSRPRAPRPSSDDPIRIVLGGVGEAAGAATPASAARIIPTAERYLGTPYRYGGTSPVTGFDCSGFVQYVFARNKVKLPRTSRQQAKVGRAMPRRFTSLAPGDLVMFAERGEPISHVAIYAGHNQIIHASSSGGAVRYDDLGTRRGKWFVDHMVAARRVTPDGRGLMLDLVRLLDAKSLADTALDIGDLAPRP